MSKLLEILWLMGVAGGVLAVAGMIPAFYKIGSVAATLGDTATTTERAERRVYSRTSWRVATLWASLALAATIFTAGCLYEKAAAPVKQQQVSVEKPAPVPPQVPAPIPVPETNLAWLLFAAVPILAGGVAGTALFFGGLNARASLTTMFVATAVTGALVFLLWFLFGYSIAMTEANPLIGGLSRAFIVKFGDPISFETDQGQLQVPEAAFIVLHAAIAVLAATLVAGAMAWRMKLISLIYFVAIWAVLVYAPIAHWIWAGGWLSNPDSDVASLLDSAGGVVVYLNAGFAGIAGLLILGRGPRATQSKLEMTAGGTFILFAAGLALNISMSALAGTDPGLVLIETLLACVMATLGSLFMAWIVQGQPTLLSVCVGALGGIAASASCVGLVELPMILLIGIAAGVLGYLSVPGSNLNASLYCRVYAVAGLVGSFMTGVLLSHWDIIRIWHQSFGLAVVTGYDVIASVIILKVLDLIFGHPVVSDDWETEVPVSSAESGIASAT